MSLSTRISEHIRGNVVGYAALFIALTIAPAWAASIGADDIERNAVRSKHIDNGDVKTADLGSGAVKESKLAADAVDSSKVAAESLTGADIAESTIPGVPKVGSALISGTGGGALSPPLVSNGPLTVRGVCYSGGVDVIAQAAIETTEAAWFGGHQPGDSGNALSVGRDIGPAGDVRDNTFAHVDTDTSPAGLVRARGASYVAVTEDGDSLLGDVTVLAYHNAGQCRFFATGIARTSIEFL